jgi:hypothetical protein
MRKPCAEEQREKQTRLEKRSDDHDRAEPQRNRFGAVANPVAGQSEEPTPILDETYQQARAHCSLGRLGGSLLLLQDRSGGI